MREQELPAESQEGEQERHAAAAGYIAAVAGHDQRALADLYDATVGRVYGLALRIVRSRQAAEEVTEDVYVQVWKSAASFDPARGRPVAWLLTICRSRALDYLRREDPAELHPEPETAVDDSDTVGEDPQNLLLACERNRRLHWALERLTPAQRQMISLAFFRGLTHKEIAGHTRMPLGTVKSDLRRALMTLRDTLGNEITN